MLTRLDITFLVNYLNQFNNYYNDVHRTVMYIELYKKIKYLKKM